MLPPWIRLLPSGSTLTVFDDRTGRDFALAVGGGGGDLRANPRLLKSGFLDPLDPALVPHRKLHPLFLPSERALLCPDPSRHPPGGWPWRTVALEPRSLALWVAVDGRATVRQIAERTGIAVDEALDLLGELAAWPVQAVLLRTERVRGDHPSLCRVVGPSREPNRREPGMYAGEAIEPRGGRTAPPEAPGHSELAGSFSTALGEFHDAIDDEHTRFDLAETTLAHALALPHPALGGQRYGERLCDRVLAGDARCVEIGGGTGELGAAFLDRARGRGLRVDYLRVDRSPALLALQAGKMPGTTGILGDALALPLADASVDVLLANEVVADLPSSRTAEGWSNDGALRFVEEVARVLAPGGVAFLSEFGSEADEPEETEQLDHPEVSIRFDRLVSKAIALGLHARLVPIAEFLGLDLDARWLWQPHLAALRHLDHRAGRPPAAARAWTPETLRLGEPVEGLRWVTLREEGPGPLPGRMWALELTREG